MMDTLADPGVRAADMRERVFAKLLIDAGVADNPKLGRKHDLLTGALAGPGDHYLRTILMDKLADGPDGFAYELLFGVSQGRWSVVLKCYLSDVYDAALSSNDRVKVKSQAQFGPLTRELERLRDGEGREEPVFVLYLGEKAGMVSEVIQSVTSASGSVVSQGAEASWRLLKESKEAHPV